MIDYRRATEWAAAMDKADNLTNSPSTARAAKEILVQAKALKLTARQEEILEYMRRYSTANGMPPTMREIGDEHDITSLNAVADHLKALKRKGAVKHSPGCARGWRPV